MMRAAAVSLLLPALSSAQCSMCFRTAAAQEAWQARALNFGILALLIPPLVIIAAILLTAFRRSARSMHNGEDAS